MIPIYRDAHPEEGLDTRAAEDKYHKMSLGSAVERIRMSLIKARYQGLWMGPSASSVEAAGAVHGASALHL